METELNWKPIGQRPHHGIVLPLFSLHTKKGPATYLDLIPLIDWCKSVGFDCLQLLPINDSDLSPYSLKSCFALNPRYLAPLGEHQMEQVRAHATSQNFFLIGDIPILPSLHSVDVLTHPELFDLTHRAGAPPDAYNPNGQNWGFPLFNWEHPEIFGWWRKRLQTAARYYHIYRLDHVVGYFRIWAFPEKTFIPTDPAVWAEHGRKILKEFIAATSMLPIAEDLGTIPPEVYPILKNLGICGTKVIRWQHNLPLDQYEPFSVTTLGTHDMDSLEAWWRNTPAESAPIAHQLHIPYHPILDNNQRMTLLKAAHSTPSYFHINLLQEYLNLIPSYRFENPDDERINWPGTQNSKNWTFRFKPTLEEILANEELKEKIREIVRK
jgi:4-alpha-glucanotransferase